MSTYKAPLTDIRFALYDVLGAEALFAKLGYGDATRDVLDAVLDEAARLSERLQAPRHTERAYLNSRRDTPHRLQKRAWRSPMP